MDVKQQISKLIFQSLKSMQNSDEMILPTSFDEIQILDNKNYTFGHYSSNIAMIVAKQNKLKPLNLAIIIKDNIQKNDLLNKIEIAGAGFINFFLELKVLQNNISQIIKCADSYGSSDFLADKNILIEYVSANPTGPLHVGHGRGAVLGSSLANIYKALGANVSEEYYVNNYGRQTDILAVSVWLSYLRIFSSDVIKPKLSYKGDYIKKIAKNLQKIYNDKLLRQKADIENNLSNRNDSDDVYIDSVIANAKVLLGDYYTKITDMAISSIIKQIVKDLSFAKVAHNEWFFESKVHTSGSFNKTMQLLKKNNTTYNKEGALWFASSKLGDEKDRVLLRDNGQPTYFANDLVYHNDKFARQYDEIINIWGADHHGYIPRMKAAMNALGNDSNKLTIILVQFVRLVLDGQAVSMSTRSGEYITFKDLMQKTGVDATRFFYISKQIDKVMDFDMSLAMSKSMENPVYYVQYAFARICQIENKVSQLNLVLPPADLSNLTSDAEIQIMLQLKGYEELIKIVGISKSPHKIVFYLTALAQKVHSYYNATPIIKADKAICASRLALLKAIKIVIKNAMELMGVSTPQKM